ncbi:Transposase for insertion sequence element IS6120 [Trichinella pseudospiralis]
MHFNTFVKNDPGTDVAGFCELSMCHGSGTCRSAPTRRVCCPHCFARASSGASCHKVSVRSVPAVVSPHARRRPSLGNQNLPVSATSNSAELPL